MSRLTLFPLLLGFLVACDDPAPSQVPLRSLGKREFRTAPILVTIDGDQQLYLHNHRIDTSLIDSFLLIEIRKQRELADTPVVVINADNAALYGNVFRIMQAAKRGGAKVVANVK